MMSYSVIDAPGPFGLGFAALVAVVLIAGWVIVATSRLVQGGAVERPERVPQLYGYTVCLIGLIWALMSFLSIIDHALALSAPELRGGSEYDWAEPSVSSLEAFRVTYDRARRFGGGDPSQVKLDTVPEAELRRRYEAMREDRIRQVSFRARNGIIASSLSLIIAVALFLWHWRWLRRKNAIAISQRAEPA